MEEVKAVKKQLQAAEVATARSLNEHQAAFTENNALREELAAVNRRFQIAEETAARSLKEHKATIKENKESREVVAAARSKLQAAEETAEQSRKAHKSATMEMVDAQTAMQKQVSSLKESISGLLSAREQQAIDEEHRRMADAEALRESRKELANAPPL